MNEKIVHRGASKRGDLVLASSLLLLLLSLQQQLLLLLQLLLSPFVMLSPASSECELQPEKSIAVAALECGGT